jgi:hypothetical protein
VTSLPPDRGAPSLTATKIVEASDGWALATRGRLVITVWRNEVTLDRVTSVDRTIRALLPRCAGAGYGSITVIEPGISMRMNDDARTASTDLQKRYAAQMKCSGYLVEGTGFLTAAVRTMTAGMHLLTRSPYPIKTFATMPDLASWVGPHVDLDHTEVARVVYAVREAGLPKDR